MKEELTAKFLEQRQKMPLEIKERLTENRIRNFYSYNNGDVYVAFSGGKDSTVLLDQVRKIYPKVPAVFCNTGLEYPEIVEFVDTVENVTVVRPELTFKQVIEQHGYPIGSKKIAKQLRELQNPSEKNIATRKLYLTGIKRDGTVSKYFKMSKKWRKFIDSDFKASEKCCDILKKNPMKKYVKETGRHPFIATMAADSDARKQGYLKTGCNVYTREIKSMPMAFWTEQDIWEYIQKYNLPYSKIYDMGESRTGCMFCMFGVQMEKGTNRFQRMKTSHPKQYDYCINKLGIGEVLDFMGIDY